MGKSAKFYKRPSRKEKESKALTLPTDSKIAKKGKQQDTKMKEVVARAAKEAVVAGSKQMEIDVPVKKAKKAKEDSQPDYVDLLTGKKTYKRVPGKRR